MKLEVTVGVDYRKKWEKKSREVAKYGNQHNRDPEWCVVCRELFDYVEFYFKHLFFMDPIAINICFSKVRP